MAPTTSSLLARQLAQYQQPPKEESPFKTWVLPAGSLLIALLSFLSSIHQIPNWAINAIVIYLAIAAAVAIMPLIRNAIKWHKERATKRRLALTYYPAVAGILVQLLENMDSQRGDNMAHLFSNINTYIEKCDLNFENFSTIKEWFNSLAERVAPRRIEDFELTVREIGKALYQYHRYNVKVRDIFRQNVETNRDKLQPLIIEWNTCREKYIAIIEKWTDTAKQINGESAQSICQDYFGPLKML